MFCERGCKVWLVNVGLKLVDKLHELQAFQVQVQEKENQINVNEKLETFLEERAWVVAVANILNSIVTQRAITDKVVVLFSGGKDSIVTLSLCKKYFKTVKIAFMYYVKGLAFQEKIIKYYEKLYGLECLRVPHFELSEMLRYGLYRNLDLNVPIIKTVDVYNYIRQQTEMYWICGGERISDSLVRRAMIKNSGSIDTKRGRFYPIAEWTKADVNEYIKKNNLKVGEESKVLGFSFRSFNTKELIAIKQNYPEDFEKIKSWFPLCEAGMARGDIFGKD